MQVTCGGKNQERLSLLLCYILGGLLCWAGLSKVGSPGVFAIAIRNYAILPKGSGLEYPVAHVLPWMEMLCGAGLVLGVFQKYMIRLSVLLYLIFFLVTGHAVVNGIDITCGCFQAWTSPARVRWPKLLWFNAPLLLASIFVYLRPPGMFRLENMWTHPGRSDA